MRRNDLNRAGGDAVSWPVVKMSEIFDIARGGSPRPIDQFITDAPDGVNWIMIGDTKGDSKYIDKTAKKIKPEGVKKSREVKKGDFLLTNSMSFGRPYILRTSGCIHDGWLVLSPKTDQIFTDYFYHYLGSTEVKNKLASKAAGAVVKNLNKDIVKDLEIPLPPLDEQKRIAAILDKADNVRRKRQQAIDLADDFLRSVFLDMFGDPVTNPKGWEVKQLNDVATKITDGTHDTPSKVNEGVKFVTGKNIRPFKLDLTDLEYVTQTVHEEIYNRCNPEYGDLLLTNIGAGTGNACFNSLTEAFSMKNVALVKSSPDKLAGRFLEYLFNHEGFKSKLLGENSKGGAQKFLSLKVIREASIPVPTFEEQLKFSALVEKVKTGNLLDPNLSLKNRELFDSLSQKVFAGEI